MTTTAPRVIDPAALERMLATGERVELLDVRSPAEYETGHIPGAINVPVDVLASKVRQVSDRLDTHVVLICQQGPRANQACQHLAGGGVTDMAILEGGMAAYDDGSRKVSRGKQRWALERQVRLVAGSLVLVGIGLSLAWEPGKFLAAFIGAGLTFSAVSNTCMMGSMLAKLPYNRGADYDVDSAVARIGRR